MSETLKLSKQTTDILKNFATINQSLIFNQGGENGTKIKTVSGAKNVFGTVTIPEIIPLSFAVYDLNAFLRSGEDLFENPVLSDFTKQSVTIKDENPKKRARTKYNFTDAENVSSSPAKDIKFPTVHTTFDLTDEDLKAVTKSANVLQLPHIGFVADGGELQMKAFDYKQPNSNQYSLAVLDEGVEDFTAFMNVDSLKIIPGNYTVDISAKKIVRFTSKDLPGLLYYISLEADSSF